MKINRILIIEDNRVLREDITTILNKQADMHIAATLGNVNNAFLKVSQTKSQVILIDVGLLKDSKELSVIESVRKSMPEVKIIGMGFALLQSDIVEFVEAGVSGFILKDATVKEFLSTIRSVIQGEHILPPLLTGSLFSHIVELALKKRKGTRTNGVRMTKREREITVLIADSLSNKEIAQQLNIAIHTVKSHVHNIMEKLVLHTRLQIIKFIHEESS